jgi:hypothetical protein
VIALRLPCHQRLQQNKYIGPQHSDLRRLGETRSRVERERGDQRAEVLLEGDARG